MRCKSGSVIDLNDQVAITGVLPEVRLAYVQATHVTPGPTRPTHGYVYYGTNLKRG